MGVISVTANIVPGKVAAMWDAFASGDHGAALALHYELLSLHDAMFIETNPIPVKTALGLMGKITAEMRLPLTPMEQGNKEKLKKVMADYKLL